MRSCYVPRFDFHIAASDYIAAEVRRLLPERLRGRLHVCPMGVDFEAFRGHTTAAPCVGNSYAASAAVKRPRCFFMPAVFEREKSRGAAARCSQTRRTSQL